jgi:hypothetical protein
MGKGLAGTNRSVPDQSCEAIVSPALFEAVIGKATTCYSTPNTVMKFG